jgi:hypothetical protein
MLASLYIMWLLIQSSEKSALATPLLKLPRLLQRTWFVGKRESLLASAACDAATPKASMDKSEDRSDSNYSEMRLLDFLGNKRFPIVECGLFNTLEKDAFMMQGLPARFLIANAVNPGPADQRQHQLANRRLIALRLMQRSGRPMDGLSVQLQLTA